MTLESGRPLPFTEIVTHGSSVSQFSLPAFLQLSMGFAAKAIFYAPEKAPKQRQFPGGVSIANDSLERQIQLVASEFKCACGRCGEQPLIICDCNMPRGAIEKKTFILNKLKEGLGVDQVIQLVDKKYGLKVA